MVKAQGILIFLSELWIPPVLVLLQFILADIKHSSRVIHRVEHSGDGEMKTSDTQFDHLAWLQTLTKFNQIFVIKI